MDDLQKAYHLNGLLRVVSRSLRADTSLTAEDETAAADALDIGVTMLETIIHRLEAMVNGEGGKVGGNR